MRNRQATFPEALRAAIERRGISLERLRERLARMGTPVSTATLSYWQSGRTQPERAASLAALRNLEDIVGVPLDALAGLLDPPRPRGRGALSGLTVSGSAFFPNAETVDQLIDGLDISHDARLTRLSGHDRVQLGSDRTQLGRWSRQVLRAEEDGPDRLVVIHEVDGPYQRTPEMVPLRNCTLGEIAVDPDAGLVAAELVFRRPLKRQETILVEHEVRVPPPSVPSSFFERRFRTPVRENLMEIRFDPCALPKRCTYYSVLDGVVRSRAIDLNDDHAAHGVVLDFGPGCAGIRWEWPD